MRNSKSSVAVACFLPGRAKDLSAPLYLKRNPYSVQWVDNTVFDPQIALDKYLDIGVIWRGRGICPSAIFSLCTNGFLATGLKRGIQKIWLSVEEQGACRPVLRTGSDQSFPLCNLISS